VTNDEIDTIVAAMISAAHENGYGAEVDGMDDMALAEDLVGHNNWSDDVGPARLFESVQRVRRGMQS
jgi:hypothetical protein